MDKSGIEWREALGESETDYWEGESDAQNRANGLSINR